VPACIFCDIVRGERAAARVFEDEHLVSFLDHRPLFPGHMLLVPRSHLATMLDAANADLGALFAGARRAGRALEQGLGAQGFLVAVNNRVSQSVPHLHVHVVPRTRGDGLKGFFWPRRPYRDAAHLEEVRARLAAAAIEVG
jgi:histidine triad (HIT) family protein